MVDAQRQARQNIFENRERVARVTVFIQQHRAALKGVGQHAPIAAQVGACDDPRNLTPRRVAISQDERVSGSQTQIVQDGIVKPEASAQRQRAPQAAGGLGQREDALGGFRRCNEGRVRQRKLASLLGVEANILRARLALRP